MAVAYAYFENANFWISFTPGINSSYGTGVEHVMPSPEGFDLDGATSWNFFGTSTVQDGNTYTFYMGPYQESITLGENGFLSDASFNFGHREVDPFIGGTYDLSGSVPEPRTAVIILVAAILTILLKRIN